MNPFLFFVDQYSFNTGNPYLKPSYNNSVSLTYRYKQLINAIFNVERATDGFFSAARMEDNVMISRSENIATRQLVAVLLYLNTTPTKWWTFNFHIAGAEFSTNGQLYTEKLDIKIYTWRTNFLSQMRLGNDWSLEVFAAYNGKMNNWQRLVQPRYWVNTAVQKKILKGKGSLKLNVEDVFTP